MKNSLLARIIGSAAGLWGSWSIPFVGIYVCPEVKKELGEAQERLTRFHEIGHQRRPFVIMLTKRQRWQEERAAQRHAIREMLRRGFTWEQLLDMEIRYRFWSQYGVKSLEEYQKVMLGEKVK